MSMIISCETFKYMMERTVLADWLLKIEKVALLTNSQKYKLAKAKSTSTSYKMLKRIGNDLSL